MTETRRNFEHVVMAAIDRLVRLTSMAEFHHDEFEAGQFRRQKDRIKQWAANRWGVTRHDVTRKYGAWLRTN